MKRALFSKGHSWSTSNSGSKGSATPAPAAAPWPTLPIIFTLSVIAWQQYKQNAASLWKHACMIMHEGTAAHACTHRAEKCGKYGVKAI